jgi:hypothetical protein
LSKVNAIDVISFALSCIRPARNTDDTDMSMRLYPSASIAENLC